MFNDEFKFKKNLINKKFNEIKHNVFEGRGKRFFFFCICILKTIFLNIFFFFLGMKRIMCVCVYVCVSEYVNYASFYNFFFRFIFFYIFLNINFFLYILQKKKKKLFLLLVFIFLGGDKKVFRKNFLMQNSFFFVKN